MSGQAVVQIIGAPIACSQGYEDAWREMAEWIAGELHDQFGDSVKVIYFDLFDPNCPELPPNACLPVVFIDNEMINNDDGRISFPAIKKRLQELIT